MMLRNESELLWGSILLSVPIMVWIFLFHPWIIFGFIIIVPMIKAAIIAYVPLFRSVDLTVAINALSGVAGYWSCIRHSKNNLKFCFPLQMFLSLGTIVLVFLVGLLWTSAPQYGTQKTLRLLGIGLPYLILPAFLIYSKQDGLRVLFLIAIISTLVAIGLMAFPRSELAIARYGYQYDRGTLMGSDPNTPAAMIVAGLSVMIVYCLQGERTSRFLNCLSFIVLPICVAGLFVSGSRANLIALLAVLTFVAFSLRRKGHGKMFLFFLVAVPGFLFAFLILKSIVGHMPTGRWSMFVCQIEVGDLTGTRTQAWLFCLTKSWDQYILLGHGPGSYAKDFLHRDNALWPHNIFFEALYEAGLVGVVALLSFFTVCARTMLQGIRASQSEDDRLLVFALSAIVLSMTMMTMTHWDFDGSRFLYLFAGLLHTCVVLIRQGMPKAPVADKPLEQVEEMTRAMTVGSPRSTTTRS